jgi:hypothetical protein
MVTDRSGMWVTRSHGGYPYDDEGLSSVLKQTAVFTISWYEKEGNQLGDQVIGTFWSSTKRTGSDSVNWIQLIWEGLMAVRSRSRSSGMWHHVMLLMGTSLLGELAASIFRAGRDHLPLIMEAAFASETLVPINQTSSYHIPESPLSVYNCLWILSTEWCYELNNEPDVMGAEFIYQLSDCQCPRNSAAWCRGLNIRNRCQGVSSQKVEVT